MPTNAKTRPNDLAAERALLGSILLDQKAIAKVANKVTPEDFYSPKHGLIYQSMLNAFAEHEPIDSVTLVRHLKDASQAAYIGDLSAATPRSDNVESYAQAVVHAARRRRVIEAASAIAQKAYEESDASEVENFGRSLIMDAIGSIEEGKLVTPMAMGDMLMKVVSHTEPTTIGVPTGFPLFDQMTGGLRRGDLIIVAARTSVGKSTYAENIAERVASSGYPVLFVSVEMSPEQMAYRFAVRSGSLSPSVIEYGPRTPEDTDALRILAEYRRKMPLYILNDPGATTMSVRTAVSQLTLQEGELGLVVVDYLQLLHDNYSRLPEHLRLGQLTKNLKNIAREFKVPVMLLSQLNRNIEYRGGEPKLADLRDSGKIEEDADIVMMLWEMDHPNLTGNVTRMKIAKNRQGAKGEVPVSFNKTSFRFTEPKTFEQLWEESHGED